MVVAGNFTSAGGMPANNIARYNSGTGTWSTLGLGTNQLINSMAMSPSEDLYVTGFFTTAGGVSASRVARYRSSTGVWSALPPGLTSFGNAVAIGGNGDVFFGSVGISRYRPSTGAWSSLGNGSTNALFVLPNGDLFAGGQFTNQNGTSVGKIARWGASDQTWRSLGAGVDGTVYAVLGLANGDVLAGGFFTLAGGQVSAFLGHYTYRGACPADFNCSAHLEVSDIFAFLSAWFTNLPSADFNGDAQITVTDIFAFLSAWFAGCP